LVLPSFHSPVNKGSLGAFEKPRLMTTLKYAPGQNYDCTHCGKCCRSDWHILVNPESVAKIRGSALELRVIQETGEPALIGRGAKKEVAHAASGACVFLNGENLCSVHAELGSESKPDGCHKFPFLPVRTPEGVFVGVSFYCSAAQRNEGRPLAVHEAFVNTMLDEETIGAAPMTVHRHVNIEWKVYRTLEDFLDRTLDFDRGLAAICSVLARVKARHFEISQTELDRLLGYTDQTHRQAALARPFLGQLLGYLGVDTEDGIAAFSRSLLADRVLSWRRFNNWTGRLSTLEESEFPDWAQVELDRYLRALLFRKFLIAERPMVQNLSVLYLLPKLFKITAELSRRGRGAAEMEPCDIYRAFDECEYSFVTHANNLVKMLARLGRTLVDGTDVL
jgi:Fe-S-cluster containining protein